MFDLSLLYFNPCLVLFLSVVQYGMSIMGVFISHKYGPPEGDLNDYTWKKKRKKSIGSSKVCFQAKQNPI